MSRKSSFGKIHYNVDDNNLRCQCYISRVRKIQKYWLVPNFKFGAEHMLFQHKNDIRNTHDYHQDCNKIE